MTTAQAILNGRTDLRVGPAGFPTQGQSLPTGGDVGIVRVKPKKPQGPIRVGGQKPAGMIKAQQCKPGFRWTWGGCKPNMVRVSDVDIEKALRVAANVRARFSHLAEGKRTLADLLRGSESPSPLAMATAKATATLKKKQAGTKASSDQKFKQRLEYSGYNAKNKSGESDKFYEVSVDGSKVTIRFGKIGSSGQTKTKDYFSQYSAMAFAKAQLAKKMAKGYKKV